MYKFVVFLNIF